MSYPDIKLEDHASAGADCIVSIRLNAADKDHAMTLGLELLGDDGACFENWFMASVPPSCAHESGVRYSANEHFAFGFLPVRANQSIEEVTTLFYHGLLAILKECGGFAPLRIWHYLPKLHSPNEPTPYQAFCRARANVIGAVTSAMCAATVIGSGTGMGMLYFLAASRPGLVIDNPRQTSPRNYPPHYANPPPLFARATLHRLGDAVRLYISGTASIVGHQSRHPDHVLAQLGEMADNLESLIAAAADEEPALADTTIKDLRHARLYLKYKTDYDNVMPALRVRFGRLPDLKTFHGEICRPELLIEMEGMIEQRRSAT